MLLQQTTPVISGSTVSLLSFAWSLRANTSVWIGARRDTSNIPWGYSWVDGTAASNLNCGSIGCNGWASGQPDNSGPCSGESCSTSEEAAMLHQLFTGKINDADEAISLPYLCEYDVCPLGHACSGMQTVRGALQFCSRHDQQSVHNHLSCWLCCL